MFVCCDWSVSITGFTKFLIRFVLKSDGLNYCLSRLVLGHLSKKNKKKYNSELAV